MQPDLLQFKTPDLEGMLLRAKGFWDNPELIDSDFGLCCNLSTVDEEVVYRGYDLVEVLAEVWRNKDPLLYPCNPVPEFKYVALWDNPYRWDLLHFVIKSVGAELEMRAGSFNLASDWIN